MSNDHQKELGRKRAQRYRDKKKASDNFEVRGLYLHPVVKRQLDQVCEFYAYPAEPYSVNEAIEACILRAFKDIERIKKELGTCKKCGEPLPKGCAALTEGGLFNGDATCWHTMNRVRIFIPGGNQ
ncbi:hypothetical protein L3Q72_06560 [Vibrio sp. JC009]|uniref:hypothetical protein n=1 Tax=Vibrio sp. JC009 TaxID=2912314 RepID=UPI0023AEA85F|nr:hypothetical protein [Vibrio sp. JC009]WED23051.1 hypothetical protein L3Q72_06560 [Vibrio sp. JC009]